MKTRLEEIIQLQLTRTYEVDRDYRNQKNKLEEMEADRSKNIEACNDFYDKFPKEYAEAFKKSGWGYILTRIEELKSNNYASILIKE